MHITLETDYAVRIIDCLARSQTRLGAQAIADSTDVTLRFSLKILRKLVQSGIVRSFKGAKGGYELNRRLEDISLNDVIETIEGPYVLNRCLRDDHTCFRNQDDAPCPYHMAFADISETVEGMLKQATFDQFIKLDA